jgi:hypothetical protein
MEKSYNPIIFQNIPIIHKNPMEYSWCTLQTIVASPRELCEKNCDCKIQDAKEPRIFSVLGLPKQNLPTFTTQKNRKFCGNLKRLFQFFFQKFPQLPALKIRKSVFFNQRLILTSQKARNFQNEGSCGKIRFFFHKILEN